MSRGALAALAAVAIAGACSDKKPGTAATATTAASALPLAASSETGKPVVAPSTTQLVTAVTDSWTSTHATLQRWERSQGGAWTKVGASWPSVIGRGGSAWGIGLHGDAAPGREGPIKKEGDGKSPAGAFSIREAYGYADAPPKQTKLEYTATGRGDLECVDDAGSEHYGKIVDRKQVAGDWESAEQMMRDDGLYTWVIDVAHNPERTAKRGSCIFLHVWSGPESTTSGCTAMEEPRLVELLRSLDPAGKPVFVLLPRTEYDALATAWGLPVN